MKRILFLLVLGASWSALHASPCSIPSGSNQSTIQSTISGCGSGNTAVFAAGSYSVTSALTLPCGVSLAGPTVTYPAAPTATITGNLGRSNWLVSVDACTVSESIEYLQFNGSTPSGGGGGAIHLPANISNITISNNHLYGNQTTSTTGGAAQDSLIWMDGSNPANDAQNITITWNVFGATGNCSNIMSNFSGNNYQGGSAGSTGGYCAGVGIHTGATNLTIQHNNFYYLEQGIKDFTGTNNNTVFCNNCNFEYNDFSNIHRIGIETQINPVSGKETIKYNSYHDPFVPFYATFGLSAANGEAYETDTTFNTLVANTSPLCCGQPDNEYVAIAVETWGSGSTANNNLIQGYWANGVEYNQLGNFQIEDNAFCGQGNPGSPGTLTPGMTWISHGGGSDTPTVSGNTPSSANTISAHGVTTCSVTASTAPTISPASGSFSGSQTVTLSDSGANTSIWYTTDGSTPAPKSGTSQFYTAPFVITSTTTVKAVGMWGALNQPASYPAGYGYQPSAVVSATYTAAGTAVLGDNTDNTAGTTAANYFNDVYAVTGTNLVGYTVNSGTVCIAPGSVTNGKSTDIGINIAPTATTEGTTALCHGTYTNAMNTSPGCVTVPIAGCGTLAPNQPYWIWTITNDPLNPSPLYFSNCGGSCNGGPPTAGVGTYGGFYLHGTYGSYAGMSSTFTGGPTSVQPSVYLNVTPSVALGATADNSAGTTAANYFNDVYAVTGSDPNGYSVNTGTVCIAPGSVTSGAKTDIGINTAPTATTEGTSAICHATYTNLTNNSPGCVTVPLSGCGTLAPNTPYWLWTITNDPIASSPLDFSNCGGSCNGGVPTSGVGSYGRFYLHGTYGSYTGMSPAFTGGPVTAGQPSVYLGLTPQ